ncbi:helix-turn-helix domain-containing protein [Leifsonia poae]|uniref:helix-turn-helix domain-containing protein n=1 Tax=Leifsonia poae TaxID=110933 RepID=UPI001CBBEB20|nr:helix-turn-helix domain-containing protein [Leifsonia poae]
MSFIVGRVEDRRQVTDARALRALAHPLRLALLNHLMAFGAQTASQCAEVVGSTASNCSYHLRSLARFGLVESVDPVDGRERPWRSTATGLQFGRTDDPALTLGVDSAERMLVQKQIDDEAALTRRAVAQRDGQTEPWREAMTLSGYALRMTPAELSDLDARLDALIRPYIALTRSEVPEGSDIVALHLNAYRHPDTTSR